MKVTGLQTKFLLNTELFARRQHYLSQEPWDNCRKWDNLVLSGCFLDFLYVSVFLSYIIPT